MTFDASKVKRISQSDIVREEQLPCICGEHEVRVLKHVCTPFARYNEFSEHVISAGMCQECGIIRQVDFPFTTEEGCMRYYAEDYWPNNISYIAKTYEDDLELAKKRCDAYGIITGCEDTILDVGSGSGAFVDECRERGAEAYGCDVATYHYRKNDMFTYKGRFEELNFPTDHFDIVTCHDVVEHELDPIRFLKEMFRITKQYGICIIDFPRYFHKEGVHHWKMEHIWYLDEKQLGKVLKDVGFTVTGMSHPIESKIVAYTTKPKQERTTVLLPPGIGDSFWSIVKLQSFLKTRKLGLPDVHVVCPRDRIYDGHKRSVPFLSMFPFIHCMDEVFESKDNPHLRKIWKEAYGRAGRWLFHGVHGTDHFVSFNGNMRVGHPLEKIAPELECDWHPPMFKSLEWQRFRDQCKGEFGDYIVWYLPFYGTYGSWLNELPVSSVGEYVRMVTELTGCIPVFTGAQWDADARMNPELREVMKAVPKHIDLLGKTSMDQLFGLMEGARGVVGFPSGLTVLAATLGFRTMMVWSDFLTRPNEGKFVEYCVPPDVRGVTYFADDTKDMQDVKAAAVRAATAMVGKVPNEVVQAVQFQSHPLPPVRPKMKRRRKKMLRRREVPVPTPPASPPPPKVIVPVPKVEITPVPKEVSPLPPLGIPEVTFVCVLKSGGHFDRTYVEKLGNMLSRHVTQPFQFVCLSDCDLSSVKCIKVPLINGYDRWWSKVELFRPGVVITKRAFYFDLDTVILDNIDELLNLEGDFLALQPWNRANRMNGYFASGMMAWNPLNYTFIYADFNGAARAECTVGDQEYMSKALRRHNKTFIALQEVFEGIYSYKRNCRHGVPGNARIICFHGRPRPAAVNTDWMKEHWR